MYAIRSYYAPQDRRYIDWAIAHATRRSRAADTTIFGFVRHVLLGAAPEGASAALAARVLHFSIKFQQFTAPVAAKGVEDTAFYVFNRLVSLNEVGADPDVFVMRVEQHQEVVVGERPAAPVDVVQSGPGEVDRITSYNVCYTKLLRPAGCPVRGPLHLAGDT